MQAHHIRHLCIENHAMSELKRIGVLGAGAMGSGIAQVAAQAGCTVVLCDLHEEVLERSAADLTRVMNRLVEKGRKTNEETKAIQSRIERTTNWEAFAGCDLVIEAIVERVDVKIQAFQRLEKIIGPDAVLATNTSSLAVTEIASGLDSPERLIGLHFFNPAPLLALVEIIPALQTREGLAGQCNDWMLAWGKVPVIARDTPGFIVNRVARPFYGEALRILEEGWASAATIDTAMEAVGFRMGPFKLMDLIGNDVNYAVTESVFAAFYQDPRYRPSLTQRRHVEAGYLGRKSGRGYYDYSEGATQPKADRNPILHAIIQERILVMLINEAVDAVFLNIASPKGIDLAMTKGVNYPIGLLAMANDWTLEVCLERLEALQARYGEDRYRPSPLMREMAAEGRTFDNLLTP
jgi:3-hydroxybutyryl-CoA dehydrogenase